MATVRRANVILQIADDPAAIQRYRDKGYSVIDNATGAVIEKAVPHDANALQLLVFELQRIIEDKDKHIQEKDKQFDKLENEIKKLRKQLNDKDKKSE